MTGPAGNLIGHAVIDFAVIHFIAPHSDNHIIQARRFGQIPVLDGNVRRRRVINFADLNALQIFGVTDHRFFLEIAHHPVCGFSEGGAQHGIG